MAVVDASKMMEEDVLQEGGIVEVIHEEVQEGEGNEGGEGEDDAGGSDEVDHLGDDTGIASIVLRCAAAAAITFPIQPPKNRHPVDKRINLEMHTQTQQHTCKNDPPAENSPQQGDHQHAEQSFRGPSSANVRDHGVE